MKDFVKGWSEAALEAVIIILVLYFVFFPFKISGTSMEATLYDGDRVFVSRILTTLKLYEKGDLIVFRKYVDGSEKKLVKRIIAVEDDTVLIKDSFVYVNGIKQEELYIANTTSEDMEITLAKDELFVMGDNRQNSTDSRHFGVITAGNLWGKVVLKVFPFSDIKAFL